MNVIINLIDNIIITIAARNSSERIIGHLRNIPREILYVFLEKVPSRSNIHRAEQRRSFVAYAVEIRGNRSVAYIIEGGPKTCSTQVLERAASSLSLSLSFAFAHFYLRRDARTHTRARARPAYPARRRTRAFLCTCRDKPDTMAIGRPETPGLRPARGHPGMDESTISNFGRETLANYRTLNSYNTRQTTMDALYIA